MNNKITQEIAQQIIDLYAKGAKVSFLANEFSIQEGTVYKIINGNTWHQCIRPKKLPQLDRITIAEHFSVHATTIYDIISGRSYKNV